MGWGNCGRNSETGDLMGYAHLGTCYKNGCETKIDHGLSYVCGGMHEGDGFGCGRYFCEPHLSFVENKKHPVGYVQLCEDCIQP